MEHTSKYKVEVVQPFDIRHIEPHGGTLKYLEVHWGTSSTLRYFKVYWRTLRCIEVQSRDGQSVWYPAYNGQCYTKQSWGGSGGYDTLRWASIRFSVNVQRAKPEWIYCIGTATKTHWPCVLWWQKYLTKLTETLLVCFCHWDLQYLAISG